MPGTVSRRSRTGRKTRSLRSGPFSKRSRAVTPSGRLSPYDSETLIDDLSLEDLGGNGEVLGNERHESAGDRRLDHLRVGGKVAAAKNSGLRASFQKGGDPFLPHGHELGIQSAVSL